MNCPKCNAPNAYVGFSAVECENPECAHYKTPMTPSPKCVNDHLFTPAEQPLDCHAGHRPQIRRERAALPGIDGKMWNWIVECPCHCEVQRLEISRRTQPSLAEEIQVNQMVLDKVIRLWNLKETNKRRQLRNVQRPRRTIQHCGAIKINANTTPMLEMIKHCKPASSESEAIFKHYEEDRLPVTEAEMEAFASAMYKRERDNTGTIINVIRGDGSQNWLRVRAREGIVAGQKLKMNWGEELTVIDTRPMTAHEQAEFERILAEDKE